MGRIDEHLVGIDQYHDGRLARGRRSRHVGAQDGATGDRPDVVERMGHQSELRKLTKD